MACVRAGCPHVHRREVKRHGYCCNQCRLGYGAHTENCSGAGSQVLSELLQVQVQRHRRQDDESEAPPPPAPPRTRQLVTSLWHLPPQWRSGSDTAIDYALWCVERYGIALPRAARIEWMRLSVLAEGLRHGRVVRISALAEDQVDATAGLEHVNLVRAGVSAYSHLYALQDVTGLDFRVQAVLATQLQAVRAMTGAVRTIENQDLMDYAFVCHGATHRSVGCCVLLLATAYQSGILRLTTLRTRNAALLWGLVQVA